MTTAAAILRTLPWRPRAGVIGVVFTASGRLVLVRHRYVAGWYPPGGGRKRRETPEQAVRRELREEIGLGAWSSITPFAIEEASLDVFVVRDAVYRPRWNLEIAEVAEFDPNALPEGASPRLIRMVSKMTSPGTAARTICLACRAN